MALGLGPIGFSFAFNLTISWSVFSNCSPPTYVGVLKIPKFGFMSKVFFHNTVPFGQRTQRLKGDGWPEELATLHDDACCVGHECAERIREPIRHLLNIT